MKPEISIRWISMNTSNRIIIVEELLARVNPLDGQVWGCDPISIEEIKRAIETGSDRAPPYNTIKDYGEPEGGWRAYHIARIAELAKAKIDDQSTDYPITIGVAADPNDVTIEEGRHRVIAAHVIGQRSINARVIELAKGDFERVFLVK
jgi:hypothetical protein